MSGAQTTTIPFLLAAVFLIALPITAAQSPAPAPLLRPVAAAPGPFAAAPSPGLDCSSELLNLYDCLTFVEPDSNLTTPDPGCCSNLTSLVGTRPECLCLLLGNPGAAPLPIDVHRALLLPNVCNVTTPPVRECAAYGVQIGVPAPAPIGGSSASPTPTEGSSPVGSTASIPSPQDGGNGTPTNLASKQHFLIGLAVVLFTSFI